MITSAIVTVAIVEVIQVCMLFAFIMADAGATDYGEKQEKYLTTKRRVLQFFIPFFWFIPMVNTIIRWWNKLK